MNRRFVLVMAGAALSFGLVVSTAQAAPAGLALLKETATSGNLVEKTHGWHRRCVRYRAWRHRHVRRGAVSCRPRWRWRRYRHCFIDRRGLRICVWRRRR